MNFKTFYKTYHEAKQQLPNNTWSAILSSNEELRNAVELMKEIKTLFPQKDIYIVGGTPRDILLGIEIDDVDMATNIPFDDLSKYFELRNISKNNSQPVYDILYNGIHYDLASFRTDSKNTNRKNNVSQTTDNFEVDSARRDITQNALGLTENGEIIDYQGGIDDMNNKVVRAVGDAKERFLEDASRILRVARFAAKLGFKIEPNTRNAVIEMKHLLMDRSVISNEAISKEFYKAAKRGKTLNNFLNTLIDVGILHDVLPEFMSMEGLQHNPEHHPEGDSKVLGHIMECLNASKFNDPVINLGVLFHDFGKATTYELKDGYKHSYHGHEAAGVPIVENIFKRLVFPDLSAEDKQHILFATANHMLVHGLDKLNIKSLTRLVNDAGWNVLKSVSYCDEASRGAPLFNEQKFNERIQNAEAKVAVLGDAKELKKKIAAYIDGHKLMSWFPELQKNPKLIGKVLPTLQDHVLQQMNANKEITDIELFNMAHDML